MEESASEPRPFVGFIWIPALTLLMGNIRYFFSLQH
jgi:hypothetical protein